MTEPLRGVAAARDRGVEQPLHGGDVRERPRLSGRGCECGLDGEEVGDRGVRVGERLRVDSATRSCLRQRAQGTSLLHDRRTHLHGRTGDGRGCRDRNGADRGDQQPAGECSTKAPPRHHDSTNRQALRGLQSPGRAPCCVYAANARVGARIRAATARTGRLP